jgi:hypothetical protein
MSDELSDFFKLISADKQKKKEEFNEMVGDLGLDSLFKDIAAEKKKIKEEKEKEISQKIEEEQKKKEEFDKLVGDINIESIFTELVEAKKEVEEEKEQEEIRQKKILNSFENFLTQKIDDIEEIKEDIVAAEEEVVEVVEEEEVVEEPSLVEKSLGLLSEPSENIPGAEQNFATLDDLQKHYRDFLVKIQQQLSTIGGGGIEDAPKTGGPYVRQHQGWTNLSVATADDDWITDAIGISTTASVGIGTIAQDGYSLYVEGDARITGILTVGQSSVTIDGKDDKIIIGTGTTITEGGNAEFVGVVTASGIHLDDGNRINMGDNDDFQIFHHSNGTGIIQNAGSGQLQIRSDEIRLLNQATNEDFAFFRDDGAVELYYDDTKRFETTGYGVTVSGISSATNVSIANTFRYPPYIIGGQVPRAVKSQGGYGRSSAFDEYQTGTEASQDPADYVEYTQELANTGTWKRFGITTAGNQARDGNWWGETNPNYDQSRGLFGGLTNPAGVDNFFDFSENTAFNNAQTSGSLKYTQALGSFSLKECNVGDLVLARFDLNIMPMVTNTTVEVALIYANRDASDNITFTFPLTITPFTYGSGTVGRGYLLRPTITAYIANDQDINSRSLLAIKADNPVLVNPIGVLFTIQR